MLGETLGTIRIHGLSNSIVSDEGASSSGRASPAGLATATVSGALLTALMSEVEVGSVVVSLLVLSGADGPQAIQTDEMSKISSRLRMMFPFV